MEFSTFSILEKEGQLWVTIDQDNINVVNWSFLEDLNKLADELETDNLVKVVIFQSAQDEVFLAHAAGDSFKDIKKEFPSSLEETRVLYLQKTLERVSRLPQATISKIEGFARGGGHEFALATDMRFAARGKAVFMQNEVGIGFLPFGGGSARLARQVGLGKALEIILSAKDFNADEAEKLGTINKALDANEIDRHVEELANRIAKFPAGGIAAAKKTIYASIDLPMEEALRLETFQMYQSIATPDAGKRIKRLNEKDVANNIELQRNWNTLIMEIQD
ncbi:MAG: enoyl-CoA hydratase/isomerase family protein [Desulfocapsaceae bacterium]